MIGRTNKIGSNIGHMKSVGNGKSLEPHEVTKWKYSKGGKWNMDNAGDIQVQIAGIMFKKLTPGPHI